MSSRQTQVNYTWYNKVKYECVVVCMYGEKMEMTGSAATATFEMLRCFYSSLRRRRRGPGYCIVQFHIQCRQMEQSKAEQRRRVRSTGPMHTGCTCLLQSKLPTTHTLLARQSSVWSGLWLPLSGSVFALTVVPRQTKRASTIGSPIPILGRLIGPSPHITAQIGAASNVGWLPSGNERCVLCVCV